MKIAVYFAGQPRTLHKTWERLLTIFDPHEVDLYFHLWKDSEYTEQWLVETLNPVKFQIEDQIDFSTNAKRISPPGRQQLVYNIFSQYYSLSQSKNIITNPSQYDFIAKLRTDMFFDKPLTYLIDTIKGDELLSANGPYEKRQHPQLEDMGFFTTPNTFIKFFNLFDYLVSFQKDLPAINSHYILNSFANDNNINYRHVPFSFITLRPNISGSTYEEIMRSYKKHYNKPLMKNLFLRNNPDRAEEFETM